MVKTFPLLKTTFFSLHHINDPKPSAHNPQVTRLAVTSWHQPKIFTLLSVRLRNKAGGRKASSTLSLTMAKKMQEIAGKVNSLDLNALFFNPATLWKSLLRL